MAVTLTSTGGLFARLGKLGHLLNTINTARGTSFRDEMIDALETVDADNDEQIRDAFAGLLPANNQGHSALNSYVRAIQTAAQDLLIRQVDADNPLPARTLALALPELIRQMKQATTHYVDANSVGATATQTNLDGDGAVVLSTKDVYGVPLENLIAEDLEITVTNTTTAGRESLNVRGEEAQTDKLHSSYPQGSGGNRTYTAIDAASSAGNVLSNGDMEDFTTANTPDDWTIDIGAAGSQVLEEASTVYKGAKALELVGDGATLTQISQVISANNLIRSRRQYAIALWMRRDATPPAAGVLTVDLHDGSGVINDEAGTANSFTIDLTALTASFVAYSGVFRLPEPLPSTVTLRIRQSTALTSGRSVFLDHVALGEMYQPSQNGRTPFVAFFSGASNWSLDDATRDDRVFRIATTNDGASLWQAMFDKLFNTSDLGLTLPTSGTTLVNDSLIG